MLQPKEALQYFKENDTIMAKLFETALQGSKPLTLPTSKEPGEYFSSIASSIISQQISTAAARAIKNRVEELLGTISPQSVLKNDSTALRSCGLSEKKVAYLKHNAEVWHEIPYRNFEEMDDETIIKELTKLYGIGRWTAEMFLMFSLARPDVFSYGDLGLMQSLYQNYRLKPHYKRKIETTVNTWSPYRTIASLTLWHTRDNPPT